MNFKRRNIKNPNIVLQIKCVYEAISKCLTGIGRKKIYGLLRPRKKGWILIQKQGIVEKVFDLSWNLAKL